MKNDVRKNRCQGRTKAGKPCRAAATAGGLCFFHGNPSQAAALGRIGGRSRRQAAGAGDPLPTLDTAIAVRHTIARLVEDLYSGKVRPSIGASIATLLNLQLRAIENTDLEEKFAKLQQLLAEKEDKSSSSSANVGLA